MKKQQRQGKPALKADRNSCVKSKSRPSNTNDFELARRIHYCLSAPSKAKLQNTVLSQCARRQHPVAQRTYYNTISGTTTNPWVLIELMRALHLNIEQLTDPDFYFDDPFKGMQRNALESEIEEKLRLCTL
ncbi:hypothetical protein AAG747_07960 [Rapidithrix thailandica]|uniref:Uncharacterized protein n=1 Tax=Rapidithrix thailandica TaxID=413964 RepID=A0AAW9S7U5_9BACT